jgi:hypothetical protein
VSRIPLIHRSLLLAALVGLMQPLVVAFASLPTPQKSPESFTSPEAVVRHFYQWYLHGLNNDLKNLRKSPAMRRYVTPRFLKEARAMEDADIFISAQDWDPAWESHISVSKVLVHGSTATTEVNLTGQFSQKLRVTLRQEAGVWKIDGVKGPDE